MYSESELTVNNHSHISKLLEYFFSTLHIMFGFDCGFQRDLQKKYYPWYQFLFGLFSAAYFVISTTPVWKCKSIELGHILHIIQYGLFILIFSSAKYNISNYLHDILSIENNLIIVFIGRYRIFNISLTVYAIFIISMNCSIFFLYFCVLKKALWREIVKNVFAYSSTIPVDMVPVIQILVLSNIYICIEKLQNMTTKSNLSEIRQFYIDIANCWDNIKPLYHKLVITSVITNTPKLMWKSWTFLSFNKIDNNWPRNTFQSLQTILILLHLTMPAVGAQFVERQVKRTKLQLLDTIFDSPEIHKEEIKEVVQYMNTRRICDKAWELMPIDVSLLTNILSITVTYLIVIIQFSHLYD